MTSPSHHFQGATVVITHRVHTDKHAEYEAWMGTITPHCRAATGYLDWHIVRPVSGLSETYTIILRFDNETNLRAWMESEKRAELIANVQPLLIAGDDFFISSGLDFWFTPSGAKAKVPVRWKQFLVTWSAIFPLVFFTPIAVAPLLASVGIHHRAPVTLVITGIVVYLMIYWVMPRYTRLIANWLFR